MSIIENEQQEVKYFHNRSLSGGKSGWGSVGQWGQFKRDLLESIYPFNSMLDIGCGDMVYLSSFMRFVKKEFDYFGIDGAEDVINKAKDKFPDHYFLQMMISDLIKTDLNKKHDVIVCYDVLFHIVEENLLDGLLNWIFNSSAKAIALSFLRVQEDAGQTSDEGHFIIRDFGKFKIPENWILKTENISEKKERQRIALFIKKEEHNNAK